MNQIVEKHKYPWKIKFFGLFILLIFLYTFTRFIYSDFSYHHSIAKRIQAAEKHFKNKEYYKAFNLYRIIVEFYPDYKKGNIRLAESCFALIPDDKSFYDIGLSFLSDRYDNKEFEEIMSFLPYEYKASFAQEFRRSK